MFKPIHLHIPTKLFICFLVLFLHITSNAQEETVIDHKGTMIKVRNNVVTMATTAPGDPLQNDVWFNTTDPIHPIISIWDGASWQDLSHKGTSGSLFFANTTGEPTEANAQLFWNNTNNRLGIGTNSPSHKLQVTGAIRSQGILNSDGTETTPSYRFNDDSNTGIYRPAADELAFTVGGITALIIEETASATTVTINETLEVNGPILDENDSAGSVGQVLTATTTGTAWSSQPIKAFGKISATGAVVRASSGVTASRTSTGRYRVTLTGVVSDGDYIIQLTQPGRGGTGLIGGGGNDDPGISYANQDNTGFDVIIGDNDNGHTDRARFNSEFMFTILNL